MLNVLVESNFGGWLLMKLLKAELLNRRVAVLCVDDAAGLYEGAKGLLAHGEPVALVLDARSAPMAARIRYEAAAAICDANTVAPLRVCVAVPPIVSLLFHRPEAVRRAYSEAGLELIELGLMEPREALDELKGPYDGHGDVTYAIITALDADDIAALRGEPPVRDILAFLKEVEARGA